MKYTTDQQKVIELHNRNLLVAAAAGSGKTAVLVERIIQMLLREEKPVDIDRLLVVTFTKAAASQMRERISMAIEKQLELTPGNEHLQKQASLLHHAQITTIDSFCQSVLRNNFEMIGIDPGFRVADPNEVRLIREDVLSEIIEEQFRLEDEAFIKLVDCYQSKGKDGRIEQVLIGIYDYALSFPWPEEWLKACTAHYMVTDADTLRTQEWFTEMISAAKEKLAELSERLNRALEICQMPDGPLPYEKAIQDDINQLQMLSMKQEYEGLQQALSQLQKSKFASVKSGSCDDMLKNRVAEIRKKVYAELEKLRKQYFALPIEKICEIMQHCAPAVEKLVSLVLQLDERLKAKKRELNLVDFSDMEHMALQILVSKEGGHVVPTQTALDYRECFEEILIDEYQDSNMVQELLLQSISGEDEGRQNRFMVGDVKQSIYRFRLARPEIFLEKYATYQSEDGKYQKIDLHQNFRSRKEVLDAINEIFYRIMRPEIGHIAYDEMAALYPGADYPEITPLHLEEDCPETAQSYSAYIPELLLLEESESSERRERIASEARLCVAKIKELIGHTSVTERKKNVLTGEEEIFLRPAKYGDMVVLLRTAGDWFDTFKRVFEEEGIPAYVSTKTGYFASMEIQTIFNYLKILDNPLQDIPMYGVMISAIGGFCEEEIVRIKGMGKNYLYEDLTVYMEKEREDALCAKIEVFLEQYHMFRECMLYTPIHELLRRIYRETGFELYVEAMPGGSRRKANLEALVDKAVAYEQTSFHGLFHFMRYIDHLRKYDVDYGEADTLDEASDLVRIMTIHASKGLEFPICFVCGLGKQFNTKDEKKSIVTNLDLGIGLDDIDPVARTKTGNLFKNIMVMKEHTENLGEELRVLYVALTRAKEKLIMTGTIKEFETVRDEYRKLSDNRCLPVSVIRDAKCMLDWILQAVYIGNIPDTVLRVSVAGTDMLAGMELKQEAEEQLRYRKLVEDEFHSVATGGGREEELRKRFHYEYPHKQLQKLYTKTTVSELKLAALKGTEDVNETEALLFPETQTKEYVPSFRKQEEKGGTQRGNAYHKALELLDLKLPPTENGYREYLKQKEVSGAFPKGYVELIRMDRLVHFRESDAAKRMALAENEGRLYREQPFVLGLAANRLNSEFPEDETVLIQGIIDVFWEEDDGIVVLDYKTDRISTPDELVERYRTQLDYYAEALQRLMHRPVKEKILYSFALGMEIICP